MDKLTPEYLRSVIDYDPQTGIVTRKTGPCAGRVTGTVAKDGYKIVRLLGSNYYAHRLAWLHVHGSWPVMHIDHIDGDRGNNALANLRECSVSQNAQNRKAHANNKTGFLGVTERNGRFIAQLAVKGSPRFIAYADSAEEAHAIYVAAKRANHTFQPSVRTV
jgi:HNH endonuclease